MKISTVIIQSFCMCFSLASASVGWVGNGTATTSGNPTKVTIQWTRQDNSGWLKFKLNESSSGVPASTIYALDGTTPVGKNMLAILLSAYSTGANVIFYETGTNSSGMSIDNLSIGNDN